MLEIPSDLGKLRQVCHQLLRVRLNSLNKADKQNKKQSVLLSILCCLLDPVYFYVQSFPSNLFPSQLIKKI